MNEKIIKIFPESGQKIVSLVDNENYGGICIKKVQKDVSYIARIKKEINPNQIIILTGIGKCYGIVRGHTILNKLHSVVINNPLIMFYPGSYDGQSFKLFNKLENDNYYRAFRLGN